MPLVYDCICTLYRTCLRIKIDTLMGSEHSFVACRTTRVFQITQHWSTVFVAALAVRVLSSWKGVMASQKLNFALRYFQTKYIKHIFLICVVRLVRIPHFYQLPPSFARILETHSVAASNCGTERYRAVVHYDRERIVQVFVPGSLRTTNSKRGLNVFNTTYHISHISWYSWVILPSYTYFGSSLGCQDRMIQLRARKVCPIQNSAQISILGTFG